MESAGIFDSKKSGCAGCQAMRKAYHVTKPSFAGQPRWPIIHLGAISAEHLNGKTHLAPTFVIMKTVWFGYNPRKIRKGQLSPFQPSIKLGLKISPRDSSHMILSRVLQYAGLVRLGQLILLCDFSRILYFSIRD